MLHGLRGVFGLLEQFHQAGTAVQLGFRRGVQVRGEGGEGFQVTVGGQVQTERAGHLLHALGLGSTAHTGNGHTNVNGGTHTLVEQVGFQEHLTVGDRDHVGRDEGRHIVGLGFDDGQSGHGTTTHIVGKLGGTFQQAGVQVEHVTGVCFPARRATQQQGDSTVGFGLLGQIIIDDQHVIPLVHPVLAECRTGEGGQPFEAGGVGCGGGHDGGVFQRAMVFQGFPHCGDGGALLADGNIDTANLLGFIAAFPVGLLVQNGVDTHGGFAGLTVTNDKLALTPANGGHSVDGFNAGLHRLAHGLTLQHRWCLEFQHPVFFSLNGTQTINGLPQWVNDAAEEFIADRDGEDFPGSFDLVAFFEGFVVT